jgi:hypothetical protein
MNRGDASGGCRVVGGWWLVIGDWWLVVGDWWLLLICPRKGGAGGPLAPGAGQPLATNHQPPPIHASSLSGIAAGKFGEGAGRPGLARCFDCFTVSTKQTCPAQPFSTRPPAGGPCFGPYRITAADIAARDAGGTWPGQQSAPLARGEQAQAIHRPAQGPPKYPSPGLHRSTTARRHRGAGSDALPTDGMGRSLTRAPARMVCDAVYFERRAKSEGWRRGIC